MATKNEVMSEHNGNHIVTVVHKLSNRTRFRIKKSQRTKEDLTKAQEILEDTPGIQKIEVNPGIGSILVLHEDHAGGAVENAITDIAKTLEALAPKVGLEDGGLIHASNSLIPLVRRLDDKLSTWSDNTIDLKALFPFLLALVGIRQLSRSGDLLGNISPLVLFYYAFDSFHKLHSKGEFDIVPAESSNR